MPQLVKSCKSSQRLLTREGTEDRDAGIGSFFFGQNSFDTKETLTNIGHNGKDVFLMHVTG